MSTVDTGRIGAQRDPVRVAGSELAFDDALDVIVGYCLGEERLTWIAPTTGIGAQLTNLRRGAFAYRTYDLVAGGTTHRLEPVDVLVADGLNAKMLARHIAGVLAVADEVSAQLAKIDETGTPFWDLDRSEVASQPTRQDSLGWPIWRAWTVLMGVDGVDVARAHKILHHKRPSVFPLLDNKTIPLLRGNGSAWGAIHDDLLATPAGWSALETAIAERLAPNGDRAPPACGTGTYPLAVIEHAASSVPANRKGQRGDVISRVAENLNAFELMVGPYAVTHLRLSQEITDQGGATPVGGVHVFLANTLDSHEEPNQGVFPAMYREVGREREKARTVKAETRVVVCIGNPPYFRGMATGGEGEGVPGGWVQWRVPPRTETVTTRTPVSSAARQPAAATRQVHVAGTPGILEDFLAPAREAGQGAHLKNLYNDYVYFWRWAIWKVFEHAPSEGTPPGAGVVSFITASSYLRGPGFVGMRQHMRAIFDDLWIIDLGGDNKGTRLSDNVFAIETPVCIAIGVRYGMPNAGEPATVRYANLVEDTQTVKYERLDAVSAFSDFQWEPCLAGWQDPFLPARNATYFSWPLLTDLFPWQSSGMQFKRSWPIAEDPEVLTARWRKLLEEPSSPRGSQSTHLSERRAARTARRRLLLKESRDRKVTNQYRPIEGTEPALAIADVPAEEPLPRMERIAYRSFDRQWAIADSRVGDYLRPSLWAAHGDHQIYLTSLGLANVLGRGPAAVVTSLVPDLDHFRGSFGGRHVIPLWRDSEGSTPNVTTDLLSTLSGALDRAVTAENLFCYCYGLLAAVAYVDHFWQELTIPGLRVPITSDGGLFYRVVEAGQRLIQLHTFGDRFVPSGGPVGSLSEGSAMYAVGIPGTSENYPMTFH